MSGLILEHCSHVPQSRSPYRVRRHQTSCIWNQSMRIPSTSGQKDPTLPPLWHDCRRSILMIVSIVLFMQKQVAATFKEDVDCTSFGGISSEHLVQDPISLQTTNHISAALLPPGSTGLNLLTRAKAMPISTAHPAKKTPSRAGTDHSFAR